MLCLQDIDEFDRSKGPGAIILAAMNAKHCLLAFIVLLHFSINEGMFQNAQSFNMFTSLHPKHT